MREHTQHTNRGEATGARGETAELSLFVSTLECSMSAVPRCHSVLRCFGSHRVRCVALSTDQNPTALTLLYFLSSASAFATAVDTATSCAIGLRASHVMKLAMNSAGERTHTGGGPFDKQQASQTRHGPREEGSKRASLSECEGTFHVVRVSNVIYERKQEQRRQSQVSSRSTYSDSSQPHHRLAAERLTEVVGNHHSELASGRIGLSDHAEVRKLPAEDVTAAMQADSAVTARESRS